MAQQQQFYVVTQPSGVAPQPFIPVAQHPLQGAPQQQPYYIMPPAGGAGQPMMVMPMMIAPPSGNMPMAMMQQPLQIQDQANTPVSSAVLEAGQAAPMMMAQPLLTTANATAGEGVSIVPADFAVQCAASFATLVTVPGQTVDGAPVATLAAVKDYWSKYGFSQQVTEVVVRSCVGKGYSFVKQEQFALGCFLLACKQQQQRAQETGGVAAVVTLPKCVSAQTYIASGFADSQAVAALMDNNSGRYARILRALLIVNLLFGILSVCWWALQLLAVIPLVCAICLFRFCEKYPFLMPNRKISVASMSLGAIGFSACLGGFIFGCIFRSVHEVYVWGITYPAWTVVEITYVILSTYAFAFVHQKLMKLRREGAFIDLPSLDVIVKDNSRALMITGWVFTGLFTPVSIGMSLAVLADHYMGVGTAIYLWSGESIAAIIGIGMFAECVRRKYYRTVNGIGLAVSCVMLVYVVAVGIPLFIVGVTWYDDCCW